MESVLPKGSFDNVFALHFGFGVLYDILQEQDEQGYQHMKLWMKSMGKPRKDKNAWSDTLSFFASRDYALVFHRHRVFCVAGILEGTPRSTSTGSLYGHSLTTWSHAGNVRTCWSWSLP